MHPIAYCNGRYIPFAELRVPVSDSGFMLGITIAEQLRTFGGKPFRVSDHLRRMQRGLETVGLLQILQEVDFPAVIEFLVQQNHRLLSAGDDLGITLFATPGPYRSFATEIDPRPTVGAHTYPLPFQRWCHKYSRGQALWVSDVQQVSSRSWPAAIKCRSRMHYFLAERQAQANDATATAVLLDETGCVSESPTANIIVFLPKEGLVSPPLERILPGISLQVVEELARAAGVPFLYRDLHADELFAAAEILLTSTPYCLLPATRLNGRRVGDGTTGPVYQRLQKSWSQMVEVDLAAQALQFAQRETNASLAGGLCLRILARCHQPVVVEIHSSKFLHFLVGP